MTDTITQVQPPLEFIPPAFDPTVRRVMNWVLPHLMRQRTSIRQIEAINVAALVELYHQFQDDKVRLLLAFRHPSTDDPFCLAHLLWREVPMVAKQQGISLQHPIHAHFIYDRGIPLWAGYWLTWLYPRLGGTPIHRGKIDLLGLRSARDLFANGAFPLAAAPEGATNGHNEIVSPLEPGISQLGFWCVEDLLKAGRSQPVLIVPIGIRYRYITPPWEALERILTGLETDTGLGTDPKHLGDLHDKVLYKRLYRLGEHLLSFMETYYSRFFHINLSATITPKSEVAPPLSEEAFTARLNALLDGALQVAEQFFNLQPKGNLIDRCRRLEQAAWDCIYREDLKLETISSLERGLADRIAEEADLRVWHMRLVESFVAVTGKYVREKPTVERFAETTLLVWDMMCRIKGGNPFKRPKLGAQKAFITVGQPISVSDRWESYQGGRKNAKQAVATLTQDLQIALEKMV
ncbi:MAG: 1-acyl-sn-glycerol-3-phosphate acyltransferase [Leptolyngbyaceae cyanobacterium RU_5_1]|nr:1-acyl-sn-glycerol-3-phosphate acyltransferase [Leptolyngbyaceae cyanobacterium RU_5_1]